MIKNIHRIVSKIRTKGAIVPSSRFLVNKMISKIEYDKDLHILQLGFGKGVFAKGVLKKISADSTLTVFEVNPKCRKYRIYDPRLTYIEDSAEYIHKYAGSKKFDHVVSTLPFASLPKDICERIFEQIKLNLKDGGKFLQFQYSLYSKKDIHNLFDKKPDIDFEILNIPPAFIYETEKPADIQKLIQQSQ